MMATYPYEDPVDPESVGVDGRRLEKVVALFRKQQSQGAFPGGQFVARRKGKLLLNEVCGIARGLRPEEGIEPVEVRPETPFPTLSAGKPIAGVAIAMLEDGGLLDVNARVAETIPGFEAHDKGEITILDVLTHRSGILMPDLFARLELWEDREAVLQAMIETEPTYNRGTVAYAPYEFGWILSEVVWRITGRSLADFVYEELSLPLGLPALRYGLGERKAESLAFSYWLGAEKMMVTGIDVAPEFEERNNSTQQFNSENPAVSLVSDGASLAGFYEFLVNKGVTRSGEQLISDTTLEKYTSRNVMGLDRSSKIVGSLGRGFMLGTLYPSIYGWWNARSCFGHAGGFSSLAFGDYDTGIAAGIVTNGNRSFIDLGRRFLPLADGLRKACRRSRLPESWKS
jgi:CubicO group peptidase (beta-lactamase class C family)